MIARAVPPLRRVLGLHALGPVLGAMLVAGVALATLLVVVTATGVAHWAVLRPMQLRGQTRYFITNRRVLIRRGQDELYLDRSRIAYVIEAPVRRTQHANLFLVLDGPQARALAASGAFGERGDSDALVPVFASIDDAETASEILRNPRHSQPALHAA
jgi:hypothetical protein